MGIQWDRNEIAMVLPENGRAPSLCPCWSGKPSRTGAWNCLCPQNARTNPLLSHSYPVVSPSYHHWYPIIYIVITTPWYTSFISHYTPINSPIHCNPMSKIPCGFLCHGRTPSSHPLILVFFRSVHEISYPAMIHHDPRQVTSITMQHEELAEAQIFRAQFTSRAGLSWASWQKHGIWVWPQGWNTLCILCVD